MRKGSTSVSVIGAVTNAAARVRPAQNQIPNFPGMGLFSKANSGTKQNNAATKSKSVSVQLPSSNRLANYAHKSPRLVEQKTRHKLTMAITDVDIPPAPDPKSHPAAYLRSIYAVRQRSRLVFDKARTNRLKHFDVDESKFKDVADYVVSIIKVRSRAFFVIRRCLTA